VSRTGSGGANPGPQIQAPLAGGGNPFPGAVAGVYIGYDNAGDVVNQLTGSATYSCALGTADGLFCLWGWDGVAVDRLWMTAVDPTALPMPVSGETFSLNLLAISGSGEIRWQWDATQWIRLTTPNVASSASLPTAEPNEGFADGLSFAPALTCQAIDTGAVYQWDGTQWNITP
jgi:hypothetical protein